MKNLSAKIIFFVFLLISVGWLGAVPVNAACTWTEVVSPTGSFGQETRACQAIVSSDSMCEGERPKMEAKIGYTKSYECCCSASNQSTDTVEAKFTIPEIQVAIPGLDKFSEPANCSYDENGNKISCQFTWIQEYVAALYKYSFSVIGIIATIILMVGGIIWIVSSGEADKIGQAKKMIGGAIIGIILLFCSTLILGAINPALVKLLPLNIDFIPASEKKTMLASSKTGAEAARYAAMDCPSDEELGTGVEFYATGYYKPPKWENTHEFFCDVGMNCSCPAATGRSTTEVCEMYKLSKPYYACNYFGPDVEYCNSPALTKGDIAADLSCLRKNSQYCVSSSSGKQTYTVKDSGGAIKNRRIDIWSESLSEAYGNTGKVTVTIGACQ